MMPMRDGIRLYTEFFLPSSSAAVPVVFIRSPYPYSRPSRNDKRPIIRYQQAGYAVVFQLTRGQGQSQGCFRLLQDDIDDSYDAIQWLTDQSWCNGKVGMEGPSYLGSTQLMAAKAKHPALKCLMPTAFVGNWARCFVQLSWCTMWNNGCCMCIDFLFCYKRSKTKYWPQDHHH